VTITTYGVTMVRDEGDIIEGTIRHMHAEVDGLLIADNRSIDGTRELLKVLADELPNVTVVDDLDPAYYQAAKMTALAARAAADFGAAWIVPFDADELWVAPAGRIADVLAELSGPNVVRAAIYNHFRTGLDTADPDPFRSMVWRMAQPAELGKVAFRWRPGAEIHQGNHGVTLPHDLYPGAPRTGLLQLHHFPYRSESQFITKAANGAEAYRLTDLPPDMGAHWRSYGEILDRHGEAVLRASYQEHFMHWLPTEVGMVRDPAPYLRWQQ